MIRLIDLLRETQYAPLYHATTYVKFLSIMDDNKIKPNKLGYIFLTRDKNYKVGGETTPIVFKVDQEKIRQRYKIFPRVGDIANKNKRIEAEEVVKGQIPLEWVEEIQVPKSIINRIEEALQTTEKGLEWAEQQYSKTKREQFKKGIETRQKDIEIYKKILNYPKLSITSSN
jgi:hypothetical protein